MDGRRWVGFGLVALLVAVLPACSRAPAHEAAAAGPVYGASTGAGDQAGTTGGVILKDDFSDPASGFIHQDVGSRGADYRDGHYEVWVDNDKEQYVASVGSMEGRPFADGRIEVTATPLSLPDGGGFGVLCRVGEDGRNHYDADVEKDGSVRIQRYDPDQTVLARGSVDPLGDGPVRLRLDCVGDRLAFFVNGKEAASATDGALKRGDVGFSAGGGSEGVTRVAFDDLVVHAP